MCHHYTGTAPSGAWTCVQCSSQAKQTPYQWLSVFIPGTAVLTLCEVIAYRGITLSEIYKYSILCVCLYLCDAPLGSSRLFYYRVTHFITPASCLLHAGPFICTCKVSLLHNKSNTSVLGFRIELSLTLSLQLYLY